MKSIIYVFCLLSFITVFGQSKSQKPTLVYDNTKKIEDRNGHLITDSIQRKVFFENQQKQLELLRKNSAKSTMALPAVPMCTNGSFEEFETVSANTVLKNYEYTTGEPLNPMQCKSVSEYANLRIKQYNPSDYGLMASTVPSNFIDEYIGNINAFDQYTLKINYKDSSPTMGLIQTKRYKTDNETIFKFNYKAVLQSITENDHDNEQPYFKARIINNAGAVVSEFCLIGNPADCIFTQAPTLEAGSIILYTPNWQSGLLDISSIPNNQEFTVEFMAARCGLNGHFGYAYIDDICLLHSNESLQGSIELDPLYKICPTLPISVCGSFSLPNSGGITATITTIDLKVYDATNAVVYTTQTPASLNLTTKRFCFDLTAANLPNVLTGSYNVSATINFGIVQTDCLGTSFASATDDDANPGWDIWFLNCVSCNLDLQSTSLTACDTNHDGKEFFNLSSVESIITTPQPGLVFSYYTTLANATNDTNAIATFANYESPTTTIFVRATLSPTCYKIIAIKLIVRNPTASISGILNVCSGSTVLTATAGTSYLWANSLGTSQSVTVTATGTYSVTVTDNNGCVANGTVTILSNNVAPLPSIVLTQPTCSTSTGSIQVTSPASEYSYDGGTTWVTNSTMSNLPYGTYLVKVKTAAGCISYSSSVNIIAFLSSFPNFSAVDPTFCGGLGSITITSPAAFYSFDDGVTWTTDNTATGLPSGIYLIRTKDAAGCISNFNSVTLSSEFLDPPLYIKDNPFCGNPGSIIITTPAAEYSFDGGTTWQTSNTLSNLSSGSYIIKIKDSQGCTSPNVYVYLNNLENSYPQYALDDAGCGTYATITILTPGDFYSFDGGTTWSTNPVLTNLNGPASFSIMVRKGAACKSYSASVYVNTKFLPIPSVTDYATTLCDSLNDGSENVDLTLYNANLIANSTSYNYSYYTSLTAAQTGNSSGLITNFTACNLSNSNNKVFVRITSTDSCSAVAVLQFTFIDSPRIYMEDRYPLCEFKFAIIDAGVGFDSYHWSSGQTVHAVSVIHDGNYSVTVTENHPAGLVCSSKKDITVFLSNPATITKIEEFDWTEVDNSIIITVTGLGIYEYSIDGGHYQDSNKFEHLKPGIYKVFVRDKYGCGVVDDEALLLNYPKFFTPNNDGVNDNWRIRFSQFEPEIDIKIFDRYGKLLIIMDSDEAWDGTYNGHLMPSDDYWFYVTRSDGKIHKGHFAMKR
ncbi:T9SS type B sorting domain-containing protein [Flavobacterium phycosphaerae]|uniref:T9SS type B sorting domain-containing protein n=1 Tax=Flavobacterium phycosphaerae TaxID=2697515 RepID=UPI001389A08D|nr:T9SS type B sorting domain-containing protein [Flavobacterium phycosphaerae]